MVQGRHLSLVAKEEHRVIELQAARQLLEPHDQREVQRLELNLALLKGYVGNLVDAANDPGITRLYRNHVRLAEAMERANRMEDGVHRGLFEIEPDGGVA